MSESPESPGHILRCHKFEDRDSEICDTFLQFEIFTESRFWDLWHLSEICDAFQKFSDPWFEICDTFQNRHVPFFGLLFLADFLETFDNSKTSQLFCDTFQSHANRHYEFYVSKKSELQFWTLWHLFEVLNFYRIKILKLVTPFRNLSPESPRLILRRHKFENRDSEICDTFSQFCFWKSRFWILWHLSEICDTFQKKSDPRFWNLWHLSESPRHIFRSLIFGGFSGNMWQL